MQPRVRLKDVAQSAKVHLSTVSLALKNDPRLPLKTRTKIQKIAQRMGYTPDAAMTALCAYRNAIRPHPVRSGLAYLTDMPAKDIFGSMVYRFAREQADRMGYNLIEYNLSVPGTTLERLQSIWWSSGLKGVLIGPFKTPGIVLKANWDRWAVATYGYSVSGTQFNRVVLHYFQNMLAHLKVLRERGYQRIGLHLPKSLNERTYGLLYAAYLMEQTELSPKKPIPVFTEPNPSPTELKKWVRAHRIDVVIGHPPEKKALEQAGFHIPRDIGFSLIGWKSYSPAESVGFAGFDEKAEVLAGSAVNFLISLLHEQAYGLLPTPRYYMVSGEFRDGPTLRKQAA